MNDSTAKPKARSRSSRRALVTYARVLASSLHRLTPAPMECQRSFSPPQAVAHIGRSFHLTVRQAQVRNDVRRAFAHWDFGADAGQPTLVCARFTSQQTHIGTGPQVCAR